MEGRANLKPGRVRFLTAFLDYFAEGFMAVLPHDSVSCAVKRGLLRLRGAEVGAYVKVWRDVWVDDCRCLTIGKNVTLGKSVMLICGGGVTIGDNCMIGHGAQIISAGHRIPPLDSGESMRFSGPEAAPITIAEEVWIGAGTIVLPGTTVGSGTVVAAGAVVTRDLPENVVAGGVPASIIRERE
jgi:acetyltransferase-like isoleucine patch superfamily enzyme